MSSGFMSGGAGPYGAATRVGMIHKFGRAGLANRTLATHRYEMVEARQVDDRSRDGERNVIVKRSLDDLHQT